MPLVLGSEIDSPNLADGTTDDSDQFDLNEFPSTRACFQKYLFLRLILTLSLDSIDFRHGFGLACVHEIFNCRSMTLVTTSADVQWNLGADILTFTDLRWELTPDYPFDLLKR